MIRLEHTAEEINFLTNAVQPGASFDAEITDRGLFPTGEYEVSALPLRLKLIALQRMVARRPMVKPDATYPVDWTPAELWTLDMVLWRFDYDRARMRGSDAGMPVLYLISKIWDGLVEYHKDFLPEELRPPRRLTGVRPDAEHYTEESPPGPPVPITPEQRARLQRWDEELGRTFE